MLEGKRSCRRTREKSAGSNAANANSKNRGFKLIFKNGDTQLSRIGYRPFLSG
jgi:hypothetical protein